MTINELKKLTFQGEGLHIEFKKKADHPEKIVKEMVAFSNSNGGWLLLGVDDDGRISGLKFPDEDLYVMEAAIHQYARPLIATHLFRIKVEGEKEVLAYYINAGNEKPYQWLSEKSKGLWKTYVRSKDQSVQASKEMNKILKLSSNPPGFQLIQLQSLEQKVLKHLAIHESLTLKDLTKIGKIAPWKASIKLVHWVHQGLLKINPGEGTDYYQLSEKYAENQ